MELVEELEAQRNMIGARVPAYGRLLSEIAALRGTDAWTRLETALSQRPSFATYGRPLLLLAALRFDSLSEGPSHPLWGAISDASPSPLGFGRDEVLAALEPSRSRMWDALRTRYVQTNETTRAVAWLWPASFIDGPLALVDLGASAGLNLIADALPRVWQTAGGDAIPTLADGSRIARRLGLDARPIDASREEEALWLRSCVWPGEAARLERLDASIAAFRVAVNAPGGPVLEATPASRMPSRLADLGGEVGPGVTILAYQTIVRDYFAPAEREAYEAGMHEWLRSRPPGRALWVELETVPDGTKELPSAIVVHAVDGRGETRSLFFGRCSFHPRIVFEDALGTTELRALLSP
ncbi:DUF2332 family protein [Vulgatibacter incomptus]|nr:DUF2332 family protein [Vulgatibacter incomptus]